MRQRGAKSREEAQEREIATDGAEAKRGNPGERSNWRIIWIEAGALDSG